MWYYENKRVESIDDMPDNVIGFVYMVQNVKTNKSYIGKKSLFSIRKRKFGKKESALVTDKRKRLYEMVKKESDWKTYYGSHPEMKAIVKENKQSEFRRYILGYAKTKKYLTYLETKTQFEHNILERPETFNNNNIGGYYFRKDLELEKEK